MKMKGKSTKLSHEWFRTVRASRSGMENLSDSPKTETGGVFSSFQFLTLYFPAFILALGYSIATPAIPVFAKSFDTGFGVASLVIVVHALGGLIAAVPTGFLVDHLGRRPMLFAGPMLMAASSCLTAVAQSFPELLCYRFLGGAAMEMWRQARLAMIADVSKSRQRGRQMSGMVGTEGAGRLLGPAVGGILATWSIRMPFIAHGTLAFLAIVPSFFLVRESAPIENKRSTKNKEDQINTRALLAMMLEAKYLGFLSAQFFASMTRGVLWGGTLLLYAAFAYGAGPQLLGGLATTTSIVGIPITLSCGYLMDRFGRKTTMIPGFVSIALGLMFLASGAVFPGIPAQFAYPAAVGDLITAVLALIAILAVVSRSSLARPLVGLFNVVGTLDLIDAIVLATIYDAAPHMGAAYWIPAFWVPALLVTHYVVFVLLGKRWYGPM